MGYTKAGETYNNYMLMLDNFLTPQPRYWPWRKPNIAHMIQYAGEIFGVISDNTASTIRQFNFGRSYESNELPIYYEVNKFNLPKGIQKYIQSIDFMYELTFENMPENMIFGYFKNLVIEVWISGQ